MRDWISGKENFFSEVLEVKKIKKLRLWLERPRSCEQACSHMRNALVCAVSWADAITQEHDGTQGHISVFKRERAVRSLHKIKQMSPSLLAFTECSPLRLRTLCLNEVSEGRKFSLQSPNLGDIWKALWSQPVQSLSKRRPSAEQAQPCSPHGLTHTSPHGLTHTLRPVSVESQGHSSAHVPFLSSSSLTMRHELKHPGTASQAFFNIL